jgi:hypothetical protein
MDSHFNFSCSNYRTFSGNTNYFANANYELDTEDFGALSNDSKCATAFRSAREGNSERPSPFYGYQLSTVNPDSKANGHPGCRYHHYHTQRALAHTRHAGTIREIQVNQEQKVRLIYSEKDKTVTGYIIDKAGYTRNIQRSDMPKSLQHISSAAVFKALIGGAYAKIRRFDNDDLTFSIHQRGLGGMRFSDQILENLEKTERALKNYDSLSSADKLQIINDAATIINNIHLDVPQYEKVTLFLGQSGAGKSTLINYLAGADIVVRWDRKKHDFFLEASNAPQNITIGHGFESCTFLPAPYEDKANGLVYFDCPGFLDSRGVVHELVNTKFIASVIKSAQAINFVITVTEASLNDRAYIHLLKNSIDALACYVQDFDSFKDSILLVVTKGADNKRMGKPGNEADDALYLNAKLEDILEEVPLSDYQTQFIKTLQASGNFRYSFKNNLEEGSSVNHAPRSLLIDKLKTIKSVESEAAVNIKPHVSAEAHAIVAAFANQVNQDLEVLTATFAQEVYDYYSNEIKALENNFFIDAHPIKTALKTFLELLSIMLEIKTQRFIGSYKRIKDLANAVELQAGNQSLTNILSKEAALNLFHTINPNLIATGAHVWHKSIEDLKKVFQQLTQALKVVEKKQPVKPGEPYMQERNDERAQAYIEAGKHFEQEQNWSEAEKNYKKALKFTDQPEVYRLYVSLLSKTAHDMKLGKAFYELGQLYQKNDQKEEAKEEYQNAIAKIEVKSSEPILKQLVIICEGLQEYGSAAKHAKTIALLHKYRGEIAEAFIWYEAASGLYKSNESELRARSAAEIGLKNRQLQEVSSEAEKARLAHEATLSQIEQKLALALSKVEDERKAHSVTTDRFAAERGTLLQTVAAQLEQKEKEKQEALEALKQAHEAKLGQILTEQEAQLLTIKKSLTAIALEKEKQLAQTDNDKQAALVALKEAHEAHKAKLAQLDEAKQTHLLNVQLTLRAMLLERDKQFAELDKEKQAELAALEKSYEAKLAQLALEKEKQISQVNNAKQALETTHSAVQAAKDKMIADLTAKLSQEAQQQAQAHQAQIKQMQAQQAAQLKAQQLQAEQTHQAAEAPFRAARADELAKMKAALNCVSTARSNSKYVQQILNSYSFSGTKTSNANQFVDAANRLSSEMQTIFKSSESKPLGVSLKEEVDLMNQKALQVKNILWC